MNSYIWLSSLSGITLLSLILLRKRNKELFHNSSKIVYVHVSDAIEFIQNDSDGYVQSMSPSDLIARDASTITEYIQKSCMDVIPFTQHHKTILQQAVEESNQFFNKYRNYYLDPIAIQQLPWRFILTAGYYENGLPHTRGSYIFITPRLLENSLQNLVATLIHEKVHIYQRVYKKDIQEKLKLIHYSIDGFRKGYPRIRANPDVDEYIYLNPMGKQMVSVYRSNSPTSITDVIGDAHNEHPFEFIAYSIASSYK